MASDPPVPQPSVVGNGLPIGLQISGPSLGEAHVLALAPAYERVTKWRVRVPSAI